MLIRCSFARRPSTVRPGSWQPLLAQPRSETEDTARWVAALRQAAPAPRFSVIRLIKGRPYVGLKCRAAEPGAALPARFLQAGAVTLPLAGIADPAVLARRIEAASGLAVRFAGPPSGDEDISLTESFAGAGIDRLSPEAGVWTGPLDALLDAWTGPAGYDWRYDDDGGAIEIVRRRSVVFRIHALAGRQLYAAAASTSDAAAGGEEGGGVQTSQSIAAETDYDPWPEIEAQAAALLGLGTRVAAATSSASLLVSGTPGDVARVRAFLRYLNREVLPGHPLGACLLGEHGA